MKAPRIARLPLSTARLVLRPSGHEDAGQALAILSDWQVSRMLRMANFPPEKEEVSAWFTWHKHEWAEGAAYRFTILLEGRMIGLADIDNIVGGEGVLGYWLERTAWGHGYASEAARAVVRFAFETVGLSKVRTAHALDTVASARVLQKVRIPADGCRPTFLLFQTRGHHSAAIRADVLTSTVMAGLDLA
jgi:ribosomal-protein-alanine N-acetyltransferase